MAEFLLREFCNHIYLGQWELARACAFNLYTNNTYAVEDKQKLISTIQNIVTNPYLARSAWSTLPCPSYVSLLLCHLLSDLGFQEGKNLKNYADFNILLEMVLDSPEKVIEELSTIYIGVSKIKADSQKIDCSTNIEITNESVTALKNAFKDNPLFIALLLNKLSVYDSNVTKYTLNSLFYNMHYQLLLNCLKSAEFMYSKKENVNLKNVTSKIYILLSLFPECLSDKHKKAELDDILLTCLELCESEILDLSKIYLSLLGRSSSVLLKHFCEVEDKKLSSIAQVHSSQFSKFSAITAEGIFHHREALLLSLHYKSHFLHYLMEYCHENVLTGHWVSFKNELNGIPISIKKLFLILCWEKCCDNASAMNVIQAIKLFDEYGGDPVIDDVFRKFKLNISLTEMCISNYMELYPDSSPAEIQNQTRKIMSYLQSQSLLRVLHSVFGLKSIPPKRLKNMLIQSQESFCSAGLNISFCVTDEAIYSGYVIMTLIMESVHLSYELKDIMDSKMININSILYKTVETLNEQQHSDYDDTAENFTEPESLLAFVNKYGCQFAYSKLIIKKLEDVREKLKNLFPLSFRVEILENIFSMLFLMAQNLSHFSDQYYDSDQGYEGENSLFDKNDSFSVNSLDMTKKKFSGRFVVSTIKLKDNTTLKSDVVENISGHASSKSTESTNSYGFQPYVFLCNGLITRDLLILLKDCVLEAKADVFKLIGCLESNVTHSASVEVVENLADTKLLGNCGELPERSSQLLLYINEALWRYEVVKSDIFQERMSFIDQQKHKLFLFQRETSTSSESTEKEAKKYRKRKKRKCNSMSYIDESVAESSIIQCMLSSPEALLRYSLWNGNLKQAEQVIDLFHLQDSDEAKEVTLIRELELIAKKLISNDKIKDKMLKKGILEGKKGSGISSIKNAAAFGLDTSNIYMSVHEELSSLSVLKTMDITGGIHHPELLFGAKNIYSLLLIDLAYISDISVELSSSLLDSANKSWVNLDTSINDLDVKVLSRKKMPLIRGNAKTLSMTNSFLKEMLSFLKQNDLQSDLSSVFWPLKVSFRTLPQALPNFIGSLDYKRFQEEVNNWKNTFNLIKEFSLLLEEEERNELKGALEKSNKQENELHMTYKKLSQALKELRDWSSQTIHPEILHYDRYLNKLYDHLRQVTSAALECKNQNVHTGPAVYTSDFSILKESPVELLKKIILQSGITPEQIENFAVRMKVDLVRVLAEACLPFVPLSKEDISIFKLLSPSYQIINQEYPLYILNERKETWPQPKHPDFVARVLMCDLVSMIQDSAIANDSNGIFKAELLSITRHSQFASWVDDCTQLAFIDLDLLQTGEEKLSFFTNVTNIAWLYAILLQASLGNSQEKEKEGKELPDYFESNCFNVQDYSQELLLSPNILERLTTQKILGFAIGQLGPISLFDLRYHMLHALLPVPKHLMKSPFYKLLSYKNPDWEKYIPPVEPKLLFVLTEGLLFSPKLQVIYSEDIDETLEKAMKDYFDFTISIDLEKDIVTLPQLLEWYAFDFSRDDENCLEKASYEGLINLLPSLVGPRLSALFQKLLSEDSAYNFSENIDSTGKRQLPFTLQFKSSEATLGIMLEYPTIQSDQSNIVTSKPDLMYPQPVIINYLKDKCHILTDLYEIIISKNLPISITELNNSIPVFNLLKHYYSIYITLDDSFLWFTSALSPYPDRKYFIQQIESYFESSKWHLALLYLNIYLEYCGKKEFNLALLRQLILEHIASINPSSEFEPSNYALCITDPLCRANTVLKNVYKWSEHAAVKALKYCLSDCKIIEFPDLYQSLKCKLKEITLYKKIIDASEMYGSTEAKDCVFVFNNWQEVADYSIWDQSRILDFLNSCEKYDLAVEWAELNIVNDKVKITALSMSLLWYLSQDPPSEQILQVLDSLEDTSDCIKLCDIVLPKLPTIEAKLCLVQYLVNNISGENHHLYYNMLLGLKMLSALKSPTREIYIDLAAHPYLLLEQMLMNVELKDAEKALKAIENDLQSLTDFIPILKISSVNQLVEDYASKALEVHFLDALLDTSSSSTLVLSIEDSLVIDEPFVMPVRVPTKEEWIPDAKIHRCQVCKEERFNMFTRRHHCRRCGRVVCANCSQHALIVEGYGNVKVRVCEECYNVMTGSISVTSSSFDKRYRILSSMQSSPRNSPYQENVGFRRRTSSIYGQQQTFRWVLSSDNEQNASVRNEFSYEQAPSISLCYSILKLHTDPKKCAQFMLNLCDRLLGKIKPRNSGKIPLEVDYSLIISMIRSLLMSAKVKCHQVHDNEGEALADLYFQHLDIMKLLVNANCRHLLPKGALTNTDAVRKLRDKLLEEERMSLALEVSTKFNLDKTGVWSSWGLFCIRAGDLPAARTKFQQCLKVINDKNDPKQESPLLKKILQVLERSKYAGTEKAAAIYKSLACLKNIEAGSNWLKSESPFIDGLMKKECLYYLNAYGTHFSTIRFYQRNFLTSEALNYILQKKCEPDIFIEAVFMPVLKNVQLSTLKHNLISINPNLTVWWNYLFSTCRHLERLKYMNVLYDLQLFMEDYGRAAKSAINFYLAPASSYNTLFVRHKYLYNAKKHFEKYLNDTKTEASNISRKNKSLKIFSSKEVESYIEIISLQEEITRFFQHCRTQNNGTLIELNFSETSKQTASPPTLFGNSQKKSAVALMVILNALNIDEGFELAINIVQTFSLDTTAILCEACKWLVKMNKKHQIPHFLACVKCFFSKLVKVDEIILECASEVYKQKGDVEEIIKMLTSDTNKINAYLMCDKLKSAYLLAIKLKSALDVRRVLVAAEQSGQASIQQICRKWLDSNSQTKIK